MVGFLLIIWLGVALVLLTVVTRRDQPRDQILWSTLLCAGWPLVLTGFVLGSILWFGSSIYHAWKRRRR